MQNSFAWIVSVALSIAAHYGLMAVAAQIPLPQSDQQPLAEVLLGNATFQAVTLDAAAAEQRAAVQTSDTLSETSGMADQVSAPVDAAASEPQQNDEIAQSVGAAESQSESSAAEIAPDGKAETAGEVREESETRIAEPPATIVTEAAPDVTEDVAAATSAETPPASAPLAPAGDTAATALPAEGAVSITTSPVAAETPPAAAPLAPAQEATIMALPAQGSSSTSAAPASADEAPVAAEVAEALPQSTAGTVEAAASELSSATSTQELAPAKPAEATPPLEAGTKVAAAITAPAPVMSQGDRVRAFMRDYRGNGCIHAQASDADAARPSFKGLGGESGAVADFAAAFRQAVGVEPELALRSVMDAQCPAVDFISAMAGDERQNLEVVLDRDAVEDGGMLIGRLEGRVQGEIMLLLVDDDGAVRDITSDFHQLPNGNFFGVPVSLVGEGRGRNQLVLALASVEPLGITVTRKPGEAAALFRNLADKIAADGLAVRTAYAAFRVQ